MRNQQTAPSFRALSVLIALSSFLVPHSSSAQTVVEVLQRQRLEARLAEIVDEVGPRVPPRPLWARAEDDPVLLGYAAVQAARDTARDRLRARDAARADSAILAARLANARWRKVPPDDQGDFLARFGESYWQAVPPTRRLLADTLGTPGLRGRLQAAFGRPTRNADAQRRYGYGGSEHVQFEYWFVVNDSVPVLALDVDGPFGDGLLVASDERFAAVLPTLKADLSARLRRERPDPWVDYYHAYDRGAWYRTGFNGAEPFTVPVRAPRWAGREVGDRWVIHR